MRKFTLLSLSCCICFLAGSANAEGVKLDMKAGLWENHFKMVGDGANEMQAAQNEQMKQAMEEMKKQFANMPPEQRKQMEQMMANSGVKMDPSGVSLNNEQVRIDQSGTRAKSCITQAEIDRGELPDDKSEECTSTLTQVAKNHFKSKQVCKGDDASVSESDIIFDSPKHYTGTGKMTHKVNGKNQTIEISLEGNWISSDCGDVKPNQ